MLLESMIIRRHSRGMALLPTWRFFVPLHGHPTVRASRAMYSISSRVWISQDHFDNTSRVFLDQIDTPLDNHQSPTNVVYITACNRFARAYQYQRRVIHQKRTFSSEFSPIIYHRLGSKTNPYSPVLGTKDTILTGRDIEDITAREKRDEPKPT
ncbi:MAG: hypothetical protein J3R72DRAFT_255454 [Linnemannia gamsii]|nr:MAG: hypothetical protein J3R72DRAFT_255454 [Linnemannia gamsii]